LKDKSPYIERFNIQTLDDLCDQARDLKLDLPVSRNVDILAEAVAIGDLKTPNRLCVQPMEGCDAAAGGVPGELTLRRYLRYAEGGFGLIWMEATAVEAPGRSNPKQLWINRRNVNAFAGLVRKIRQSARDRWGHEILIVLQLAHAGRYCRPEGVATPLIACHNPALDSLQGIPADHPVVSDEYIDRLQESFVVAGRLALEAGFDGIDIKACHGDLLAELLCATNRSGRYGGSLENRSRFIREVVGKLKVAHPGLLLASRISLSSELADSADSVDLVRTLESAGVGLLSISSVDDLPGFPVESIHPLEKFVRLAASARTIQQAVPNVPVIAGGLSWFRHFIPNVAAGVVHGGGATLIGLGRAALAYPSLAGDLFQRGQLDPDQCCIRCGACIQLIKDGGNAGCAIMDSAVYGEEYQRCRHFALDNLREEAKRCRGCEPAPCRSGCPTRINVPSFLKAFADDQIDVAYEILRKANVLPGMCSHLCPVGLLCEGRCVAGTLDGIPIPIHDIQYAAYWNALQSGLTGLHVPDRNTDKRVAIVGAGPAGISCAVTLLERGHHVVLFERSSRLGGTPELAIRSNRFSGAHDEVEAILKPALYKARLMIKFGTELGQDVSLDDLRRDYDAVFLAAGVWGEQSLGDAEGVVPGVNFLSLVKSGVIRTVPSRVILLAGGDSAMDSARVALELGAEELLIVYAGALSEMHWHMADSWFRTEGVHFMTMTRPVGYRIDAEGKVSGLKIQRILNLAQEERSAPEDILKASLIIESMGLGVESSLASALPECSFTDEGLLKTADASSLVFGLPGVFAGGGMTNGGATVVQCIAEGMRAGCEMDLFLAEPQRSPRAGDAPD